MTAPTIHDLIAVLRDDAQMSKKKRDALVAIAEHVANDLSTLGEPVGDAFAVYVNTDLTEGRGMQYPAAVCHREATAQRLAHGADVQGTNGTVKRVPLYKIGGTYYGPVRVHSMTDADRAQEEGLQREREAVARRNAAIEKARAAGLSEEDLAALRVGLK